MINNIKKFLSYGLSLCLIQLILFSCTAPPLEMRAYIDENPHWKMVENCGYENCLPMVDFLTAEDITLRIEYDQDYNKQYFIVKMYVTAINNRFFFNPSNVVAKTKNRVLLKPKGFKSGLDLNQMRSNPPLREPVQLKRKDSFSLLFDQPVSAVASGFTLDLTSALTSNGKQVDVPLIYFKKTS